MKSRSLLLHELLGIRTMVADPWSEKEGQERDDSQKRSDAAHHDQRPAWCQIVKCL